MAGAGYKLFNTGDVLTAAQVNTYLMEQTVMVFADAAARTTALTGVVSEGMISYLKDTNAVEVYNGSAWVASDDPNAIQNTIVDAKGDLITATAADTPARLAVGSNGDTLVADSSATTGLRWQSDFAAGKNKIINGDFQIWQRGTSFSNPSSEAFTADRYRVIYDGAGATRTLSQQTFTPGTAPVAGYEGQYFHRFNQSVAGSGASYNYIAQRIEDARTFAGQTVTLSFWAKAAASTTLPAIYARQRFGSGGSSETSTTVTSNVALTTSWQRFTYTFTVPSVSGATIGTGSYLTIDIYHPINTTFTVDLWGIQLEAGSVATAFQTATGTLAGELAACQRYYWRLSSNGKNYISLNNAGYIASSTVYSARIQFPVSMRTQPTSVDFSNLSILDSSGTFIAISNVTIDTNTNTTLTTLADCAITGGTVGRFASILVNNNSSAFLGLSAEL